jgi:hypothetical protein
MATTGIKLYLHRSGPERERKQPHLPESKLSAHHLLPHHAVEPERTRREISLEPALALEIGLRLLEERVAEEAPEGIEKKSFDWLKQIHDASPKAFELAYERLTGNVQIGGFDFYEKLQRGLAVVCGPNSHLTEPAQADTMDHLLLKIDSREALSRLPETIALLFRAGELSAKSRRVSPKAGRFMDTCLSVRWDQKEEASALAGQLANEETLRPFLAAADLIMSLHEKQLARLEIESSAEAASEGRQAAARALKERKEDEKRSEKKRLEQRQEEAREILREIASEVEAAALIKLGRAVLAARVEIESLAGGLDQLTTLARLIETVPPLLEPEAIACFSVAGNWSRLDSLLDQIPSPLRENFKDYLASPLKTWEAKRQALETINKETLESIILGYELLQMPNGEKHYVETDYFSPMTLAEVGRFASAFRAALAGRSSEKLVPLVLFGITDEAEPAFLSRGLASEQKRLVINKLLESAGPAVVPALLAARGPAAAALPPSADQEASAAVDYYIADTLKAICLKQRAALAALLECADEPVAVQTSPPLGNLRELARPKTVKQPELIPLVLTELFNAYAPRTRSTIEEVELRAQPSFRWNNQLEIEVKRLAADNGLSGIVSDRSLVAYRKAVLALALRVVTVKELIAAGRLPEARLELRQLLAQADAANLKLDSAHFLALNAGALQNTDDLEGQEQPPADGLLRGLVMRQVGANYSKATALISTLRSEPAAWEQLLGLVREQPATAAGFIEGLIEEAKKIADSTEVARGFRLIRHTFDSNVLKEALSSLSAPELRSTAS